VHSLRNYLVNPAVHIPLLERLVGIGMITDEEKAEAKKFKDVSDEVVKAALTTISAKLKDQFGGDPKASQWFDLAGTFFALLRKANV